MSQLAAITILVGGAVVGGALADGGEAFLLLFGSGVTGGAFLGACFAWVTEYEPRWGRATGIGTIYGGFVGLLAAIVDAGLPS